MTFRNRRDAGQQLAERCRHLRSPDTVVLGLPRGGVPVAAEVARALGAPLDVIVVRKLGAPGQPELALGALGEGGVMVVDEGLVARLGVGRPELDAVVRRETAALADRVARWRRGSLAAELGGRTTVIVDDGLATGSTARAACQVARAAGARQVVLAVPVAPVDAPRMLAPAADEVICLETPSRFGAVGLWYDDFSATSDAEVEALLAEARSTRPRTGTVADLEIPGPDGPIVATLMVPADPRAVVAVAHGTGSGRDSPRNRAVAEILGAAGVATILPDLGDGPGGHGGVDVLARRFDAVVRALDGVDSTAGLAVGALGASTGAAVALWAASVPGSPIAAVVSRGGRPDLAAERLPLVRVPTLLVVGGRDTAVLGLNQEAARLLGGPHRIVVVAGATHLFAEPGTLQAAGEATRDWMLEHLGIAGRVDR